MPRERGAVGIEVGARFAVESVAGGVDVDGGRGVFGAMAPCGVSSSIQWPMGLLHSTAGGRLDGDLTAGAATGRREGRAGAGAWPLAYACGIPRHQGQRAVARRNGG